MMPLGVSGAGIKCTVFTLHQREKEFVKFSRAVPTCCFDYGELFIFPIIPFSAFYPGLGHTSSRLTWAAFLTNPKEGCTYPCQLGYVVSPACPGSAQQSPPSGGVPGTPPHGGAWEPSKSPRLVKLAT